jgi:hypothetical protein
VRVASAWLSQANVGREGRGRGLISRVSDIQQQNQLFDRLDFTSSSEEWRVSLN